MKYGKEAFTEKPISKLVLGTVGLKEDRASAHMAHLDNAFELGYNTFDTARGYGSEPVLGQWMRSREVRDQVVIISKGGSPRNGAMRVNRRELTDDLTRSLEALGVDFIDLYLLHHDDPNVPVEEIIDIFDDFWKQGYIRAYGASNCTAGRISEANAYAAKVGKRGFVASSPDYSLAVEVEQPWLDGCVSISGPKEKAQRAYYISSGIPVIPYSSLAGGLFSGRMSRQLFKNNPEAFSIHCRRGYCFDENFTRLERAEELAARHQASIPQIALAFLLHAGFSVYPITGAANRDELQNNLGVFDVSLSKNECDYLDLLTDEL
ncbi:MAG: aldo/keto reductase [Oscillospiraceae bacterium]|nr:aldo/keto reductase [Oscillospiraceae bacterium]